MITQSIIPCIWFEGDVEAIAEWYVSKFPDSFVDYTTKLTDTPSGETTVVTVSLAGQFFQLLGAGPLKERNPSISYMVAFPTSEEVETLWNELVEGAEVLMPLDTYDFSERYGWLKDKHGVSWQIMHSGGMDIQTVTPCFLFVGDVFGRAEAAMNDWISIFPDSYVLEDHLIRYEATDGPELEGKLNYARFVLSGREFVTMDSAENHQFAFNEMQSLIAFCETQAEIDDYWAKLSAVPEAEQCGWLQDRYGVSWQIVPWEMEEMLTTGTKEQLARVTEAFLPMKKIDVKALRNVY
ncbi:MULTISPECIES: VOC family protein [Exiguobacterium]|uniref:VOC family protein n=1 Tax=Exiguobacterium TaxID=33986 RepID=UPI0005142F3A|nr:MULTISPECIES: VOC family protein [unclassified Exiguobacterium]KGI86711.1 3-demethylubiquinone-9 3-methyltransferase [Exiguobacterium mexicanum]